MTIDELQDWRRKRLKELIKTFFGEVRVSLAVKLGYKDGSYIGQMLNTPRGKDRPIRPIDEKTVAAIEALDSRFAGWFDPPGRSGEAAASWRDMAHELARSMDAHAGPDANHFQAFCKMVDSQYNLIYSAIRPTTLGGETSERVEGRHKRPGINTDH